MHRGKQEQDKYSPQLKRLFLKTIFIFAAIELASSIASIVDGLVVERYIGETALQTIGLMWPYVLLTKLICNIIMTGTVIMCSDEIGKGNQEGASKVFSMAFTLILIISIPVMILIFLFSSQVASLLGAEDPSLHLSTSEYLRSMTIGLVPNILTLFLMPLMQLDNDRKRVPIAIVISTSVNILFNMINTVVFEMGIFGIGLATALGYLSSCIFLMLHFRKKDCILKMKFCKLNRSEVLSILNLGKINGVNRGLCLIRNTLVNRMILVYGGLSAFTAHSVFSVFKMSIICIPMGMGSAGLLLVSLLYAECSKSEILKLWRFAVAFSIAVLMVLALTIILFSEPVLSIYMKNEMPDEAIRLVRIFALGLPLLGLRELYMFHLIAIKNNRLAFISNFLGEFFIITVAFFAFGRLFGTVGMWAAYPASELLFWAVIIIISGWKKKKGDSLYDNLLALSSLSVKIRYESSISVTSKEDFDSVVKWIGDFCRRADIDSGKANRITVLIESALILTLDQKASAFKKARHDIRLILFDDDILIIRLRNNCIAQQLLTKEQVRLIEYPSLEPELSLLYGMSEDVKCITSMNLNNLIIKLNLKKEKI